MLLFFNLSYFPDCIIDPSLITKILSHTFNVFVRCVIIITVLIFLSFFIKLIILFSVILSRALVASSKIIMSFPKYSDLAIAILCLSPPEIFIPRSEILEFNPFFDF